MKAKIITQTELAKILGTSRSNLTQMITGKTRCSIHPKKAERYSRVTGVGLMAWFTYPPSKLKREIELALGVKINTGRGRLSKQSKK